ncbi:YhdP family protein [Dongshaea marina]|uniref:YhdP family protein n=1 Tax=Dongshaea marina TaxID=2047966 RepID=UPI000D3E930D|nr:YhdP family protein [Dongshaea marina]
MVYRCLSWLWFSIGLLIFLLAILITASRYGPNWFNSERQQLLDWLFSDYQFSVSASELALSWHDGGPALLVTDVEQKKQQGQAIRLEIGRVYLHLKIWKSLQQWRLQFDSISFEDLHLLVNRDQLGASQGKFAPDQYASLTKLLLQQVRRFSLTDSSISLLSQGKVERSLKIKNLSWINGASKHQGVGLLRLRDGSSDNYLRFVLNVAGDPAHPSTLDSELYLDSNQLMINQNISGYHSSDSELSAELGFKLWARFKGVLPQSATLQLLPEKLNWSDGGKKHQLEVPSGGRIDFQRLEKGWVLASSGISSRLDKGKVLPWQFRIQQTRGQVVGDFDDLDLLRLSRYATIFIPDKGWAKRLYAMDPQGSIRQLKLTAPADLSDFTLTGVLDRASWRYTKWIPGVKEADGRFSISRNHGSFELNLTKQQLASGSLFSQPLELESFKLPLSWHKNTSGWQLDSKSVVLNTADLKVHGAFNLSLPSHGDPNLAIYSDIDLLDASKASNYFPHGLMDEEVIDYLHQSIQGGSVHGARLLWYGDPSQFPYAGHQGIFEVDVPLKKATFQFDPEWPALTNLDLNLAFKNDGLTMRSDHLMLGKGKATSLVAKFDSFDPHSVLKIQADLDASGKSVTDYLSQSALKDSIGQVLKQVQVKGPVKGDLSLAIPLDDKPVRVNGHVQFKDNQLLITPLGMPLKGVTGTLKFSDHDSSMSDLQATFHDMPMRIDYSGVKYADRFAVDLKTKGKWTSSWLRKELNLPENSWFSGGSPWSSQLKLSLPSEAPGFSYQFNLDSPMTGVEIKLPTPFIKAADATSWPLNLDVSGDEKQAKLTGGMGKLVRLNALLDYRKQPRFNLFALKLGDRPFPKASSNKSSASIQFALGQLKLADWLTVISEAASPEHGTGEHASLWPSQWSLNGSADKLLIDGITPAPMTLQGTLTAKESTLTFSSGRQHGVVVVPTQSDKPLQITLHDLQYQLSARQADQKASTQDQRLRSLPWLTFNCSSCSLNGKQYQQLSAELKPTQDGVTLQNYRVEIANSILEGKGAWSESKEQTELSGELTSPSLQKLIEAYGNHSPIKDAPTKARFDFNWKGTPLDFALARLNGSFSASTDSGSLLEVSDKGTRLLSILSFQSLIRKLRLDFHDVFDKGFPFDSSTLSGTLSKGVVNDGKMEINGAAGLLSGKGSIDLGKWQIDSEVAFSPDVTGSLPVLAAFAITPVTGVVVYALSKIFAPVINVITQIRFRIVGDLSNPKVEEVGREQGKVKVGSLTGKGGTVTP